MLKAVRRGLEDEGIEVSIQKAITTTSIYLTLDHGALNSLRIGDHKGKAKYYYGYEIGSHIRNYHELFGTFDGKTFIRQKFPENMVAELISAIRTERSTKIQKFGQASYDQWKTT